MLLLSLIWAVLVLILLFSISFGTYCLLFRSDSTQKSSRNGRSSNAISLCNCFACGVFLSTCFIGLIPHLREHEAKLRQLWSLDSSDTSNNNNNNNQKHVASILIKSELIVLCGFLFILLLEQIFHSFQSRSAANSHADCSGRFANLSRQSQYLQNGHKTNPQSSSKQTNCASYKDAGGRHQKVAPNSLATSTLLSFEGDQEPLVSNRFDCSDGDDLEENQEREPFVGIDSERIAAESTGSPKIEFRRVVDEYGDGDSDIHGYGVNTSDECGGGHSHLNFLTASNKKLNFSSCLLLVGLSTHSVFEGIALGVQTNRSDFYALLLAIMLHEVLCSFAFGINLVKQRTPFITALLATFTLASCIPVGMCSSIAVNSLDSQFSLLIRFVLEGLAAGTFIYVACVEMLSAELSANHAHSHQPQSAKCRDSFALDERHSPHPQADMHIRKALAVVMGVCVFFVLSVVFGRHNAMASINKHSGLSTNSH